jgi:hypothetical protein
MPLDLTQLIRRASGLKKIRVESWPPSDQVSDRPSPSPAARFINSYSKSELNLHAFSTYKLRAAI